MPLPAQQPWPTETVESAPLDDIFGDCPVRNPWEQMSRDAYDRGKEDGTVDERERLLRKIFPNEAVRNTWWAMDVLLAKLEKWRNETP